MLIALYMPWPLCSVKIDSTYLDCQLMVKNVFLNMKCTMGVVHKFFGFSEFYMIVFNMKHKVHKVSIFFLNCRPFDIFFYFALCKSS